MFLNGKKVQSETNTFYDVHNPATGAFGNQQFRWDHFGRNHLSG